MLLQYFQIKQTINQKLCIVNAFELADKSIVFGNGCLGANKEIIHVRNSSRTRNS